MARKAWAPNGADRLYTLVRDRYYDDARFFRVVKDFVAQFGLAADPRRTAAESARTPTSPCTTPTRAERSRTRGGVVRARRSSTSTRQRRLTLNGFPLRLCRSDRGHERRRPLYSGMARAARRRTQPGSPQDRSTRKRVSDTRVPKLDYVNARVTADGAQRHRPMTAAEPEAWSLAAEEAGVRGRRVAQKELGFATQAPADRVYVGTICGPAASPDLAVVPARRDGVLHLAGGGRHRCRSGCHSRRAL